jgi:hypothetical protein
MKTLRKFLAVVLFSVLVIGAGAVTHMGTKDDPFVAANAETLRLVWDNTNVGVKIERVIVLVTDEDGPNIGTETRWEIAGTWDKAAVQHEANILEYVSQLPDGLYKVQAQVVSEAQVPSALSAPIWFVKDWAAPQPPSGCIVTF